jgi:hypothetical protein
MRTEIDNGRYQNSQYDCGENPLSRFTEFLTWVWRTCLNPSIYHARKGNGPNFSTGLTISIMRTLIPNPSTIRQTMSSDERDQFLAWCEEQRVNIFNNAFELLVYCMDDINVLRQAWCAFRNLLFKLVEEEPFRQAIRILSICNKLFRTMNFKSDTVCIIAGGG